MFRLSNLPPPLPGDFGFETNITEAPTPRPLVLDCGANIGLGDRLFQVAVSGGEVHAFEPDPAMTLPR
ncbi:MAG: hypothetical protein U0361_16335 [Nitrospiraceae bacterium]